MLPTPCINFSTAEERDVVTFTDINIGGIGVEITGSGDLPKEWARGRQWHELDILAEACFKVKDPHFRRSEPEPNFDLLYTYLRSLGFRQCPMFMHVWPSRLKKK